MKAIARAYLNGETINVGEYEGTVSARVLITFDYYGTIKVDGVIQNNKLNEEIGTFSRRIYRKQDDVENNEIHHGSMYVQDGYRKYGVAGLINNHSYAWFKRAGYTKVSLEAASDGLFVWQLLGFTPNEDIHAITWVDK